MEELPLFGEEFLTGAIALVKDQLLPLLLTTDVANPQGIWDLCAPFRGNRMTKVLVEMAYWDLWAKSLNHPYPICSVAPDLKLRSGSAWEFRSLSKPPGSKLKIT
jgi:hypothetical protein